MKTSRSNMSVHGAVADARTRARELFDRFRIYRELRRRDSRIPFFFRGNPAQFRADGAIEIGRGVVIDGEAWFSVGENGRLIIGDNVHINRGFVVSCAGRVTIGQNVVMADRVFIGDANHGYEDVSRPILLQPMAPPRPVTIEDDCWLGINACILAGVTIGRHSVIGANSVVTRSIPPFSVACGNPASVVKQYDPSRQQWVRASSEQ